jgi:hypothetical protein
MTNPDPIENALREFSWDNYGMDGVSYALDADPDAQEWVPDLAKKIRGAIAERSVDPTPAFSQRIALGASQDPNGVRTPFDMLRQVFASQDHFQRLLGYNRDDMTVEERVEYLKGQIMALQAETVEALDEMSWKPWTHGEKFVNREAMAGELADIFCFLVNIAWGISLTAEDFYTYHQEKALRNIKRQEDKYDGVQDKCPGCRRDINDLKAKNIPVGTLGGVDYCSPECIVKVNPHMDGSLQSSMFHTNQES